MPKNTIRDILPPERRQSRRAPVNKDDTEEKTKMLHRTFESAEPTNNYSRGNSSSKLRILYFTLGGIISIFILAFIFSLFFGGAHVSVTPRQETLTVSGTFIAVQEAVLPEDLKYEIMSIEDSSTKSVPATGTEDAEIKASGEIVVYNDDRTADQRLIRNTRFETPEGLIYKIDKSIVVPGQKNVDGKLIPGSITVTVYADEPGDKYNTELTDFTVPGFEGTPQFETFYARSKTTMTGGFIGERLIVDEGVLKTERELLQTQLRQDLLSQIETQKPEGFVSFDSGVFVDFKSDLPSETSGDVEIVETATLYNVLFNENELAKYLARNTLGGFDENDVGFISTENLLLSPISPDDESEVRPWEDDEFAFSLNGNANIVWLFDEERLKGDLSGRNKDAITTILSGYPGIEEAEVSIRPFWKNVFPVDTNDIKIEVILKK